MMIVKLKVRTILFLLLALGMGACALSQAPQTEATPGSTTGGTILTWTPRPQDLTMTALPTATQPAPVSAAHSATPTPTGLPASTPTPRQVTFSVEGGNLNVRRGPSVDYNYVGVLYDGDTTVAVGRDRISRWVLIELPDLPDVRGWVTTETDYSTVKGDVSALPFVTVEPATPAYIRNCTKHEMRVYPGDVQLLTKYDEPYNEEQFGVGIYQVFDLENPKDEAIQTVNLSEGKTVDILYDWAGEKSKCE
ncbi:MAG: hypothetical protein AB8I58_05925 [Anaerolineales bacterium]